MAKYSYKCLVCGQVFDIQATIQEKEEGRDHKFACPKCRSKNVKQEFSAVNFVKNVFAGGNKASCCSNKNVCDDGAKDKKGQDGQSGGCGCS